MGQGWDFHTFWPQGLASICVLQVLLELFVCSRRHEDTGALYVADMSQHCVRRLGPDGISYSCLACITWGRCLGNEIVRKTKVWGCTPGQVPGIVAGQQGLRGGSAGGVDCMGRCACQAHLLCTGPRWPGDGCDGRMAALESGHVENTET